MTVSPRERRLQQMTEKGYMDLTPTQRGDSFRHGLNSLKELQEEVRKNDTWVRRSKAGEEPRE